MYSCKMRIIQFISKEKKFPSKLADLPKIKGYDSGITDGWQRKLLVKMDSNGIVEIKSFGKDGTFGGDGENSDMIGIFAVRDKAGEWLKEPIGWSTTPKSYREESMPKQVCIRGVNN